MINSMCGKLSGAIMIRVNNDALEFGISRVLQAYVYLKSFNII